jgi:hypothetical protein
MEEYQFRSPSLKWLFRLMGIGFSLMALCGGIIIILVFESVISTFNVPYPEASATASGIQGTMRAYEFGYGIMCAFLLAMGISLAAEPSIALRRARHRAVAWQTAHSGAPWYRVGSLDGSIILTSYLNLSGLAMVWAACLAEGFSAEASRSLFIAGTVFQTAGILMLGVLAADLWRRRHFRKWRLHLEQLPVQPDVPAAFEIRREDGKPLGEGLRFEFVGRPMKGNRKNACANQSSFLRRIPGEVHAEPFPSVPPFGVKGSLRLDVAGLSTTPPDGVKKPKRFFAFLRVRQGCWRRCLFELPLGEVFAVPESLRAGATE